MNLFSISQLAQLSGIKPHTIRIWEQRYNALRPSRSEGNTRHYDNTQLRRLLNIVSLIGQGHKVSELASLPDQELFKLIKTFQEDHKETEAYFISQLVAAGMNYDEWHFEKIFSHCILRLGMRETYIKILYPMLVRMGLMWAQNTLTPAYEHFNSNLLRQKIFTAIDALPPSTVQEDGWLLFLPENEFHELGLLFAQYLIKLSGKRSIYLGSDLPMESVAQAAGEIPIENLLLFLVHNDTPEVVQKYLEELSSLLPDKNIYISANPDLATKLKNRPRLHWLHSAEELEQVLQGSV